MEIPLKLAADVEYLDWCIALSPVSVFLSLVPGLRFRVTRFWGLVAGFR
jgi:hypothetical protein